MSLGLKLTLRYLVALGLVAFVISTAYFFFVSQLSQSEKDGYIVNISGMQRMLSQRIALLASEVYYEDSTQEADALIQKMDGLVDRMARNHKELISGRLYDGTEYKLSEDIKSIYFSDGGLNSKVQNYLSVSQQFIDTYNRSGLKAVQNKNLKNEITRIARNGLLKELNAAVFAYQDLAETKIHTFEKWETSFFLFGLFVLLMEALFIFRPMVKKIVADTTSLERANAELTEFSYRISHDLRAPIISSIGLSDVIDEAVKDGNSEVATKATGLIKTSLIKLENLIEDVINLTKMKMTDIKDEEVEFSNLVQDILKKLDNLENFSDIKIDEDIQISDAVTVKKLFLEQSLENLISNAIKYSDPTKEESYIKISASKENENIILSVRDNGRGIPKDHRNKIFKMFERFHPNVSFGSGLGLYLVQQNAKALNGQVKYIPHHDGTEFKMTFPAQA